MRLHHLTTKQFIDTIIDQGLIRATWPKELSPEWPGPTPRAEWIDAVDLATGDPITF